MKEEEVKEIVEKLKAEGKSRDDIIKELVNRKVRTNLICKLLKCSGKEVGRIAREIRGTEVLEEEVPKSDVELGLALRKAKPLVEKDIDDFLETRHLYHELGKVAFWTLCPSIQLDARKLIEENPVKAVEYIVSQFRSQIESLLEVREDAKILQEKEAELIYATAIIDELKNRLQSLESLYTTVTSTICQGCRQRIMVALGLQYFSKMSGIEVKAG